MRGLISLSCLRYCALIIIIYKIILTVVNSGYLYPEETWNVNQ